MGLLVVKNAAANFLSKFWLALLQLVFTPFYLQFLGAESYGLVGFYTTILATLLFLDQAISPTLTRELARGSIDAEKACQVRNTLATLEVVSVTLAALIGVGVYLLAPILASEWIKSGSISIDRITWIIRLMGISLTCQWPTFLYGSGFIGLQCQDKALKARVYMATLQWGGGAFVLWLGAREPEIFFEWQILILLLTTVMLRTLLWKNMPSAKTKPKLDFSQLKAVWRFAFGSLVVGVTTSLLTQADKLLVSRHTSLDQFAAYSLSFLVASALVALVAQPIGAALLPQFTALMTANKNEALAVEYHRWTQITAVILFPITAVLIAFPEDVVRIWLHGNTGISIQVSNLLPWVAIGSLLNVLGIFPYTLQLAAGKTRLLLIKNVLALTVVLPILTYGVPVYGPIIGAFCWIGLNAGYYLIEVPLVHQRLLKEELFSWWLRDTAIPAAITGLIFFVFAKSMVLHAGVGLALVPLIASIGILAFFLPYPRLAARACIDRLCGKSG